VLGLLYLPWFLFKLVIDDDGRKRRLQRLALSCSTSGDIDVLLHGVSVGEVKAIRGLVDQMQRDYPDLKLAISTTTVTGYQTAKSIYPDLDVLVYPLDMFGACSRFLNVVSPGLVVLAELELWPNFLRACQERNIDVAVVNGRITQRSLAGYLRIGRWLPRFGNVRFFGVQTELYSQRFEQLGVDPSDIVITGNIKFDSLHVPQVSGKDSPWSRWSKHNSLLLAASTHSSEETQLLQAYSEIEFYNSIFVLVPRHPHRCANMIGELQRQAPQLKIELFSKVLDSEQLDCDVLVVDALGQLEQAFANSDSSFIGGSLVAHGGQNLLEAAVADCPLVMGASFHNFEDEVELLLAHEGMHLVKSAQDVLELMRDWQRNPQKGSLLARNARNALESQRGTAKITLAAMRDHGLLPLK
jgi:3-deoxy-D-manno-octulosonic-acid transferase